MKITSNVNEVLPNITENLNFIAVGELHHSRSAIKFIVDNLNILLSNKSKNYLLTEFLPPGIYFKPNDRNRKNFNLALKQLDRNKIERVEYDIKKREEDKGNNDNNYTLKGLYNKLFEQNVEILSIEEPSAYGNVELNKKIKSGELKAYEDRVNSFNEYAKNKAIEILKIDKTARILIFAGMGHVCNGEAIKFTTDGEKIESQLTMIGVTELLRKEEFKGISINVHDPDLCEDAEFFQGISYTEKSYIRHATKDKTVVIDSPDYLLFLKTPEHKNKKIHESYEGIFLPTACDFKQIKDKNYRLRLWKNSINPRGVDDELNRITRKVWKVNIVAGKVLLQDNSLQSITDIRNYFAPYFEDIQVKTITVLGNSSHLLTITNINIDILKRMLEMPAKKIEEIEIKTVTKETHPQL